MKVSSIIVTYPTIDHKKEHRFQNLFAMPLEEQLENILERRKNHDLSRSLVVAPSSSVDSSSNDFLGLSRNKILYEKFLNTLITFPHPSLVQKVHDFWMEIHHMPNH
ncbi:serine C-palmitoyltransferase LCB2 [Gigaspora margarita]|uniref:Serine C-palmitoyltransferase LCB2 n=1 Tax=Gigaspora margarita TaxID=4874 RepID=A0A8H3X3B4_GIGMA|nr:serine C-palmitoyltransferase LCB2 [Gigaspora margarita]